MRTKEELLIELALARRALSANLPELACRCNPVARLKRSFTSHPASWIAASTVAGLLATKLLLAPRGAVDTAGKKEKSGASPLPLLAILLKSAWSIARPATERILRDRLASLVEPAGEPPQETA